MKGRGPLLNHTDELTGNRDTSVTDMMGASLMSLKSPITIDGTSVETREEFV